MNKTRITVAFCILLFQMAAGLAQNNVFPTYQLPLLRKDFSANKGIKQAVAYICGLGHFDLFLNGQKVGNHFLDCGWTLYSKEALYETFDVDK